MSVIEPCTIHGEDCQPWTQHVTERPDVLEWNTRGLSPVVVALVSWQASFIERADKETLLAWLELDTREQQQALMETVVGPSPV